MKLLTNSLILIGAIIMALNIKRFREITTLFKLVAQQEYHSLKPILFIHQSLIGAFFIGYIVVLVAINSTEFMIGNLFVGIIFISGAIFVLLGTDLQKKMIKAIEATYEETFMANEKLHLNQNELAKTNQILKNEIQEHKETSENLKRSYDTQKVVNEILKKSLREPKIEDIAEYCLDLILSLPWLSFEYQGSIHLVEENPETLVLITSRGFSDELKKRCNNIPFGKCLCGLAAEKQKMVFASNIDERHDILLPGTADHGHYCVPILVQGSTIGVINIYVKPGHKKNAWEEDFLKTVANTMAIVLMRFNSEKRNKEMKIRLNQSQKMESIGTLAGGIAHDFNNILSGIFGYAQLAERNIYNSEKTKNNLHQIIKGAQRASDLIKQILTFSRKVENKKTPVRLDLIIREAIKFLRASMPATIKINEELFSRSYISADPTQIQQIVMNLCTNSFHAMKDTGGELSINLSEVDIDDQYETSTSGVKPGTYLQLVVKDTGHGIPPDIINRIFEPYYTTKKVKEGTGLGLSVVHGIIQNHNGLITVNSELGKGSIFKILLPKFEETNLSSPDNKEIEIERGTETILIVDDEESILNSTAELLRDYGYTVKPFLNAMLALEEYEKEPEKFDLIITDMTMPDMTGEQFALRLLEIEKNTSIILCTGYSDKINKNKALKMGIKKFFQKPIDSKKMLLSIRKILDEKG